MSNLRPPNGTGVLGALLDGRYRVESRLATGGMSAVYRGTDTHLDRGVAIKVMDRSLTADPALVERFRWEARAAARLDHPHAVEVFDQGVHPNAGGDQVFLVMELVGGATLRDMLDERGALPVAAALSVAEPMLAALAAAHRAGLVHCDVKPENVLVDREGTVKVADFGLVRALADPATHDDVLLGTVGYLAPERLAGGRADARSDVYAAGIVLHEMLTGTRPGTGDEPGLAPELHELVRAATRRDPATRPQHAAAFLLALQRVRDVLGLPGVRPPAPGRSPATKQATIAFPARSGAPSRGEREAGRTPDPRPPFARNRRAFAAWVAVVATAAAAALTAGWWLGAGRYTAMPTVAGLDRPAATDLLADSGLHPAVRREHDDVVPRGVVIASRPPGGHRAVRGSQVTVVLSAGRPAVPRPSVGSPPADVARAIRAADLRPVRQPGAAEFSAAVAAGSVLAVRPPGGTVLPVGAPVTLVLSKGPAPTVVPQLRGRTEAQARAALSRAGLVVERVRRRFDDEVPPGRAITSYPRPGQDTSRGREVTLVLSTAPGTDPVPGPPRG